ncbi:TetR/AcrR family transcriptional regulator [Streptomyces griseosporeus]|uniref:TetR/AcrR family transcriptional regulator n=1 Tax=Streptomyces griseosporeus TaxID=1910 RepID=UPI0036FC943B
MSPRKLEKQIAIASAAGTVFGREGYARASVDALAAAAGVSTRTLYNHFPDGKAQLFRTVFTWTSAQVKDAQIDRIQAVLDPARLPRPEDLERDLVALARFLVDLMADFPDHFALVRHIHAEADPVPPEVLRAWQKTGPEPVRRALTEAMGHLADAGMVDTHGDAALTAGHYTVLTWQAIVQLSHHGIPPLPRDETDRLIGGGVAAFLRAYREG